MPPEEAMNIARRGHEEAMNIPLNPFAVMALRRQEGIPNQKLKKRSGPKQGARNQAEHLRLAEMDAVLPVRFLLCLVAF